MFQLKTPSNINDMNMVNTCEYVYPGHRFSATGASDPMWFKPHSKDWQHPEHPEAKSIGWMFKLKSLSNIHDMNLLNTYTLASQVFSKR